MRILSLGLLSLAVLLLVTCKPDKEEPEPNNSSYLNPNLTYGSVTDIDGNSYKTIKIGTQTWMAENLRVTRLINGDSLTKLDPNGLTTSPLNYSFYQNDSTYKESLGNLYSYYLLYQELCPSGWYVPTEREWASLTDYLGGLSIAGGKMKSTSNLWQIPNSAATNESGFSAIPGGYRNGLTFGDLGYSVSYACLSEYSTVLHPVFTLSFDNGKLSKIWTDKNVDLDGYYIRCVKAD